MLMMVVVHGRVMVRMVCMMVRMRMMCGCRRCRLHPQSKASVKVLREAPHDAHIDAYAHRASLSVFFLSSVYFT